MSIAEDRKPELTFGQSLARSAGKFFAAILGWVILLGPGSMKDPERLHFTFWNVPMAEAGPGQVSLLYLTCELIGVAVLSLVASSSPRWVSYLFAVVLTAFGLLGLVIGNPRSAIEAGFPNLTLSSCVMTLAGLSFFVRAWKMKRAWRRFVSKTE